MKTYSTLPPAMISSLIPFSLECSGLLGSAANKFLSSIRPPEECPGAISSLRMNMSRVLARAQAQMMINTRQKGVFYSFF